jgi:replicative DNA helicase
MNNHYELTLLACCLLENALIDRAVLGGLTKEWFTDEVLAVLWRGMTETRNAGRQVDLTWAVDHLLEKTGQVYEVLSDAVADVITTTQFDSAFEITKKQYLRRTIGQILLEAHRQMLTGDPVAVSDRVVQELTALRDDVTVQPDDDVEERIEERISTGIKHSWGYHRLDHATRGVEPYFMIIAGDSGHLKSTMMFNLAYNLGESGMPVHIFSGEMSSRLLIEKMATIKSGMNTHAGIPTEHRPFFMDCVREVRLLPIFITESVSLPRIRIEIAKRLCGVYFIDYLQLVESDVGGKSRQEEVSNLVKEFMRLKSDYKVCIVAISALNRGEREGEDRVPGLHNLKDSGAIEYGSDYVWFMYYKWRIKTMRDDTADPEEQKKLRTFMSKNRIEGWEGRIDFEYDRQSLRLKEVSDDTGRD